MALVLMLSSNFQRESELENLLKCQSFNDGFRFAENMAQLIYFLIDCEW